MELQLNLGTSGLVIASTTNLELVLPFAEVCQLTKGFSNSNVCFSNHHCISNFFKWLQIPQAIGLVNTFLVTGPLCRYACDLKPMFQVLLLNEVRTSNLLRSDLNNAFIFNLYVDNLYTRRLQAMHDIEWPFNPLPTTTTTTSKVFVKILNRWYILDMFLSPQIFPLKFAN